ncbi:hypothetical protein [Streptomyces atratus]|uniref:hypothetical protein n=1 Tax=Streptomyces atratus TaxID=1893 RepID=UPI0022594339|nr:hypothetical protein [Streptomyces atratus]MCX5345944.1 hypothetical protein [Streptomyces atratus]
MIELLKAILEHANALQIEVQHAAHRAVLGGRSMMDVLIADEDSAVRAAARDLAAAIDSHACAACFPV